MRTRGVLLLEATAPTVLVAFAVPQIQPPGILVAVKFDYTDYDLQPPSAMFVNPFTGERLQTEQLHTQMLRGIEQPLVPIPGAPEIAPGPGVPDQPRLLLHQPLIMAHEGGWPFLCLPGVREYHNHPGHSGDPWELHRPAGAGNLVRLVETICKYAVEPIIEWGVRLVPQVGFNVGQPPA